MINTLELLRGVLRKISWHDLVVLVAELAPTVEERERLRKAIQ